MLNKAAQFTSEMKTEHHTCLQRAKSLHLRLSKIEGTEHQLRLRVKPEPYPCKLLPLHHHLLKEKRRERTL